MSFYSHLVQPIAYGITTHSASVLKMDLSKDAHFFQKQQTALIGVLKHQQNFTRSHLKLPLFLYSGLMVQYLFCRRIWFHRHTSSCCSSSTDITVHIVDRPHSQ